METSKKLKKVGKNKQHMAYLMALLCQAATTAVEFLALQINGFSICQNGTR